MFKLVTEAKALNTLINEVVKAGATYRDKLHVAAVSALVHAAEFGQCAPLNRIYSSLTSNDQTALRGSYVRRIHAAIGGIDWDKQADKPIPQEMLASAVDTGMFLGFKDKEFFVHQGKDKNRKVMLKIADILLNPPEDSTWLRFFDRNNLAEIKVFGDSEVLSGIKALVTKAEGDSERSESRVSKKAKAILEQALESIETLLGSNEVHDEVKTPKKAKAKKESAEARPN